MAPMKSEGRPKRLKQLAAGGTVFWYLLVTSTALVAMVVQCDRQGQLGTAAAFMPEFLMSDTLPSAATSASQRGDLQLASHLVGRLLKRRPIPAESLSLYAQTLLADGRNDAALNALQIAAARGWRDRFVQKVTIDSALHSNSIDIAGQRILGLWRIGEKSEWLTVLTKEALSRPEGLKAFKAGFVVGEHYIGTDFLIWASSNLPPIVVDQLASGLAGRGSVFDCSKFSRHLDGILRKGDAQSAGVVWERYCTPRIKAQANTLAFGSQLTNPGPSDWRYAERAGLSVDVQEENGTSVLHYISEVPTSEVIARRYIFLTPGLHVILFTEKQINRDMKWQVSCFAGTSFRVTVSPSTLDRGKWVFDVPQKCRVQELSVFTHSHSGEISAPRFER